MEGYQALGSSQEFFDTQYSFNSPSKESTSKPISFSRTWQASAAQVESLADVALWENGHRDPSKLTRALFPKSPGQSPKSPSSHSLSEPMPIDPEILIPPPVQSGKRRWDLIENDSSPWRPSYIECIPLPQTSKPIHPKHIAELVLGISKLSAHSFQSPTKPSAPFKQSRRDSFSASPSSPPMPITHPNGALWGRSSSSSIEGNDSDPEEILDDDGRFAFEDDFFSPTPPAFSSSSVSPPSTSSLLPRSDVTPKKIKKVKHLFTSSEVDPGCRLTREQYAILYDGKGALSSENSPRRAKYAKQLHTMALEMAGVAMTSKKITSPQVARNAYEPIVLGEPWYRNMVQGYERTFYETTPEKRPEGFTTMTQLELVNWPHIESRDTGGGWHFCPLTHPDRGLVTIHQKHLTTGVFSGTFPTSSGTTKDSTFFPDDFTDEEQLYEAILRAPLIARNTNVFLCELSLGGKKIHIMQYRRGAPDALNFIHSAFPVFDLIKMDEASPEYVFGGGLCTISHVDLVATIERLKKEGKILDMQEFQTENEVIIDMAEVPEFALLGVRRAIFLMVPKELVNIKKRSLFS